MKQKYDPIEFGRRVRELRDERELSQPALAAKVGCRQSNLWNIENGKFKDPEKQALKYARALRSTTEWLLTGKGRKYAKARIMPSSEYDALPEDLQERLTAIVDEHQRREEA